MSNALFRAIVGQVVPLHRDTEDEVPVVYRRTAPLPPAPKLLGSASSEPLGDFRPTEEYPTNPSFPY